MSGLRHGACGSHVSDGSFASVPIPVRLSPEQAAASEREYVEHRQAVIGMLRREFPPLRSEVDELYQQAWIEFLELRASGTTIHNPRPLLQKIAWRAARARLRRRTPQPVAPESHHLLDVADGEPLPEEQAQIRVDAGVLRAVVDSLDRQQAAALKLRFDYGMNAREIQRSMGVSAKRLEKIVTEAYAQVSTQLSTGADGEPVWLRRQRSLLLACVAGVASAKQRERAQRVVDADPRCRAMLEEMRATLHRVAEILPAPMLVDDDRTLSRLQSIVDRLSELWAGTRQMPYELTHRGLPTSGAVEHAGSAAVGAGATAKIVAMCIAAGGTAAACIEAVRVLDRPDPRPASAQRAAEPRNEPRRVIVPARVTISVPLRRTAARRHNAAKRSQPPVSSPRSTAPPSPAPEGSEEFGPGAIGSTDRPTAPAPAPSDGGGEFTP